MPKKPGILASNDYVSSKQAVESMEIGETKYLSIDNCKRVQKYIYEIGLKMKPRKEFSTKKISFTELRITRIL
jgi:hypothetical protein